MKASVSLDDLTMSLNQAHFSFAAPNTTNGVGKHAAKLNCRTLT